MRISKPIITLFLLPAVLVYLAIFLYPTLRAGIMSFYQVDSISASLADWKFIGFSNFKDLFQNDYFLKSAVNVLKIWFFGGIIVFFFAFLYAAIINSGVRFKGFWRSMIYLPNTVSAVVLSVVWLQYIYSSNFGFLTTLFKSLGLDSLAAIQWTDSEHILLSMLIAYSFGSIGYFMLILGAGMDRIPHDYYEAALLEGAGPLHRFFNITMPLLRDVFRTTLVLWTVTAMNFFVWSATFGLEDPSTMTPGYFMYLRVFGADRTSVFTQDTFNVGAGAAVGVLITLSAVILSTLISRLFRSDRLEY